VTPLRQRLQRVPASVVDAGLAVAVAVAVTTAIRVSLQPGERPGALAYALGLTIAALVLARRRWPVAVLVVSAATLEVYNVLDYPGIVPAMPLAVALAAAWAAGHQRWSLLVAAWFVGETVVVRTLVEPEPLRRVLNETVPDVVLLGAVLLLGEAVRTRRALRLEHRLLLAEQEQSERLLLNVLPPSIAARLKQTEDVIADAFADVTVLFADIVDFTRRSERIAPEQVVQVLNDLFSVFDQLAQQRGLEKIKTIGDAYMVVGGLPNPRPDHAEAVAEMALAMREEVARRRDPSGQPVAVRIGMDTGPVIAGVIGTSKFSYDLWGDTVNTASRMESHGVRRAARRALRAPCRRGHRPRHRGAARRAPRGLARPARRGGPGGRGADPGGPVGRPAAGSADPDLRGLRDPGRVQPGACRGQREPAGVAHRAAAGVVVEEHEDGRRPAPPVGQPPGPAVQGRAPVAGCRRGAPLVEAEVGPVGGAPDRRGPPRGVCQAERGTPPGQQLAHLAGEPARMAQLDRDPHPGREAAQGGVERGRVGGQVRGELQQHRPELRPEVSRVAEEAPHRLLGLAQAADMGQVPARLDRDHEVVRGPRRPGRKRMRLGQAVEGVVGLDHREPGRVVLEPGPLGQPLRVEAATPVAVLPARRADQDRHVGYQSEVPAAPLNGPTTSAVIQPP